MNEIKSAILTGVVIGLVSFIGMGTGIYVGIRTMTPPPHFNSPVSFLYETTNR